MKALLIIFLLTHLPLSANLHANEKFILPIVTEHYPPFEMKEAISGLKGFDYEVMVEIFARLNLIIDIEFLPWNRALAYTRSGKVLGILTCAFTEERSHYMIFSDPISNRIDGFYTRKGFNGIIPRSLKELKGQRVASVSGYASLKALIELNMSPTEAEDTEIAIKMLKRNRFDYLYLSQQSTDFIIHQLGLSKEFDFHPIAQKDFYFCFSKKYKNVESFVPQFNKALKQIKLDGTYKKIHDKYR